MSDMKSCCVIGCGWLGLPLAEQLVGSGYRVVGSTTSIDKCDVLESAGVSPFVLRLPETVEGLAKLDMSLYRTYLQCDVVVITLPFRRAFVDPSVYVAQLAFICGLLEGASVSQVIFTSSTSVYPLLNRSVDENDGCDEDNPRSVALHRAEQLILGLKSSVGNSIGVVLRLAGLVGGDRRPGAFLSRVKGPIDGDVPVNLVHRDDCLGVISAIIDQGISGEVFNVCADFHPTKREFYSQRAALLGLDVPEFGKPSNDLQYKSIDNAKVKSALSYTFRYPDPMTFPHE